MAVSYGYDRTRPRTRVELDSSNLSASNVTSEKPLVLLGSAQGGQPHTPITLTNFAQAKSIFRGGELLDAIEMAWKPSPNRQGAGKIIAVRTDEATNATLVDQGLTVNSKLYGFDANSIQVEYTTNTLTGAKRFSVYFTKERYERVYDNIGNIFSLKYTGEEAQATVSVEKDPTTHLAARLVLSVGTDVGTLQSVRTYELGTGVYEDVNVLVNDINNLPDFEATMNSLGGNKNIKTEYLDALDAVDIKTAEATITSVAGDLMNQTKNDRYVSVEIDFSQEMPTEIPLTNLTGGETNPPPASWAELFAKVADLGAYYIVPLTADEAIHGELAQFLRNESDNGNHLRGTVGGGFEESISDLRSRQMNLRNSRVRLVGNSGRRRMSDGRVYHFPAYMFAALVAGISSGLEIGEPATYKHVSIESLDTKFTGDQLDELDAIGVVMAEFVRTRRTSYYRIVSDPTTYNSAFDPVQNKNSLGEISDFLATELRTILDEEFIGTRIHHTSASILKNRVESFLDTQKDVGGLIVDYSPDDVQVIITGNTARINMAVQPAQGLDYINVTVTYEDNELTA